MACHTQWLMPIDIGEANDLTIGRDVNGSRLALWEGGVLRLIRTIEHPRSGRRSKDRGRRCAGTHVEVRP